MRPTLLLVRWASASVVASGSVTVVVPVTRRPQLRLSVTVNDSPDCSMSIQNQLTVF
jgi:hypothetical protein